MASSIATQKVNELYASVVQEVAITTIDEFKSFLSQHIEFDDDMNEHFDAFKKQIMDEFKAHAKASKGRKQKKTEDKKPRKMSAYNLYIKEKMAELKDKGHTGNLMKLAVEAYNAEKKSSVVNDNENSK